LILGSAGALQFMLMELCFCLTWKIKDLFLIS